LGIKKTKVSIGLVKWRIYLFFKEILRYVLKISSSLTERLYKDSKDDLSSFRLIVWSFLLCDARMLNAYILKIFTYSVNSIESLEELITLIKVTVWRLVNVEILMSVTYSV
jgi:hypothetical protein